MKVPLPKIKPKHISPNNRHHRLHKDITLYHHQHLQHHTHSYYSSDPYSHAPQIYTNFSPRPKDSLFGSLINALSHKWTSSLYAHPPHHQLTIKKIQWASMSSQDNPNNPHNHYTPWKDGRNKATGSLCSPT